MKIYTVYDYEYKRCGVCNMYLACESLAGKQMVNITERKNKQDWAYFLEKIALQRENAFNMRMHST